MRARAWGFWFLLSRPGSRFFIRIRPRLASPGGGEIGAALRAEMENVQVFIDHQSCRGELTEDDPVGLRLRIEAPLRFRLDPGGSMGLLS